MQSCWSTARLCCIACEQPLPGAGAPGFQANAETGAQTTCLNLLDICRRDTGCFDAVLSTPLQSKTVLHAACGGLKTVGIGYPWLYHWQSIMFCLTLSEKYQGVGSLAHAVLGGTKRARSRRRAVRGKLRDTLMLLAGDRRTGTSEPGGWPRGADREG